MSDRLQNAFNLLREGGATFAGRARLTNYGDTAKGGMTVSFRLDVAPKDAPDENPHINPFKGAYCSPKDGHEFMVLVIPVANGEPERDVRDAHTDAPQPEQAQPPQTAEKRELNMASKAAMFCQEKDARGNNLAAAYFADRYPHEWEAVANTQQTAAERADACLKYILGIESKRELDADPDFASGFETLRRDLNRWRNEEVSAA